MLGHPAASWLPCVASAIDGCVCTSLLFLDKKGTQKAEMTNGRIEEDLLGNYQCFPSLNFPLVSHYFILGDEEPSSHPQTPSARPLSSLMLLSLLGLGIILPMVGRIPK